MHGLNIAMYVGSGLTLAAALVAFFGLKGFHQARQQAMAQEDAAAAPTPIRRRGLRGRGRRHPSGTGADVPHL